MRRDVTVTVADAQVGAIEDVVAELRAAGMEVDGVLAAVGAITGSIAESQLAAIAALPGVAAVEQQTSFQLPPPDAEVQ